MQGFRLEKVSPNFFQTSDSSKIWNQDLQFDLSNSENKSQMFLIHAPSGSGKSSFFKFLIGQNKNFSGNIFYADRNLKSLKAEELSRMRNDKWSLIFQDFCLFEHLPAIEHLKQNEEKGIALAEKLGIAEKLNNQCATLSFGERQRLGIIRALLKNYEFLIMDEAFSHLDEKNRLKALELIEEDVKSKKASMIRLELEEKEDAADYIKYKL